MVLWGACFWTCALKCVWLFFKNKISNEKQALKLSEIGG